jgi:enoyl-CoA hydratase/carnithine racemase
MGAAGDGVLSVERPAGDPDAVAEVLVAAREALAVDDEVVILHGAGDAFLLAAPVREPELRDLLIEVCELIARRRRPVIAACDAPVLDGGLELALACDLRFARRGVPVGMPAALAGVPSVGAAQRLTRFGGPSLAAAALLLGETPRCGEDRRLDGVFEVIEEDVLAAAISARERIMGAAPLVIEALKTSLAAAASMPLDAGLAVEADLASLLLGSADRAEGLAARSEERPPRFRGA